MNSLVKIRFQPLLVNIQQPLLVKIRFQPLLVNLQQPKLGKIRFHSHRRLFSASDSWASLRRESMHSLSVASASALARLQGTSSGCVVEQASKLIERARLNLSLDAHDMITAVMFAEPLVIAWGSNWELAYLVGLSLAMKYTYDGFRLSEITRHVTSRHSLRLLCQGEVIALGKVEWRGMQKRFALYRDALHKLALCRSPVLVDPLSKTREMPVTSAFRNTHTCRLHRRRPAVNENSDYQLFIWRKKAIMERFESAARQLQRAARAFALQSRLPKLAELVFCQILVDRKRNMLRGMCT